MAININNLKQKSIEFIEEKKPLYHHYLGNNVRETVKMGIHFRYEKKSIYVIEKWLTIWLERKEKKGTDTPHIQ